MLNNAERTSGIQDLGPLLGNYQVSYMKLMAVAAPVDDASPSSKFGPLSTVTYVQSKLDVSEYEGASFRYIQDSDIIS